MADELEMRMKALKKAYADIILKASQEAAARMRMEALKKAYADIILKASQEAAARVMVAEMKALCFEHDLVSLKEESLRMFLRLKENSNKKLQAYTYLIVLVDACGVTFGLRVGFLGGSTTSLVSVPKLPPAPQLVHDEIQAIFVDEIVSASNGGYQLYLIQWKGHPASDNSWLLEDDSWLTT